MYACLYYPDLSSKRYLIRFQGQVSQCYLVGTDFCEFWTNLWNSCEIPVIRSGQRESGGGGGGKLSTSCFVYEAALMRNLHSFFIIFFFIIKVNTGLLILANVVEFLRQASLNVFSCYPNLKICLNFNGS